MNNYKRSLMKEYNKIKKKYYNYIIIFQIGEFYEIFNKDAILCSKILNIILTKRNIGKLHTKNIYLSGFPCKSLYKYINILLKNNLKLVICNQKKKKKKIYRKITHIITPGTIIDYKLLINKNNNYICSIYFKKNNIGISLLDISTREFFVSENNIFFIKKIINNYNIKEILYKKKQKKKILQLFLNKNIILNKINNWWYNFESAYEKILCYLKIKNLKIYGIENMKLAIISAYIIYKYLLKNKKNILKYINQIKILNNNNYLWLDDYSIKNLELINSENGISLFKFLNKNKTILGTRLLKKWIINPIKNKKKILIRYKIINFFIKNKFISKKILIYLKKIFDLERLFSKLLIYNINIKELYNIAISIKYFYFIYKLLNNNINNNFKKIKYKYLYKKIFLKINKIINKNNILKNINYIKKNVSNELDIIKKKYYKYKKKLKKYIILEKKKYNFNFSFNNFLGYYINISKFQKKKKKIPKNWIHKQTLSNNYRYKTKIISEIENNIFLYKRKIKKIEKKIFKKLIKKIKKYYIYINNVTNYISKIDILLTFSIISKKYNYKKPIIKNNNNYSYIKLKKGRHPIIEYTRFLLDKDYIANDIYLNYKYNIIIISGPNMSGKSVFLRLIVLLIIMAQMGCYVPVKYFKFTIFNKIFTRIGFNDDVLLGQSTYMVEMSEISNTINNLYYKSLIIFDEIGRGTSNYDGISIAWAIIDYLYYSKYKPIVLISTHYHELNLMKKYYKYIRNFSLKIIKKKNKIYFLRKLINKKNNKSYGIQIASLLKLPKIIITKSKIIFIKLLKGFFLKKK